MNDFIASLLGGLGQIWDSLVGKTLVSMGLGFLTFSGMTKLLQDIQTNLIELIGAQGPVVLGLANVLQVGTCINMMASALVIKMTMNGFVSGMFTKMFFNSPATP